MSEKYCPCGSGLPLIRCCAPIINMTKKAETAEELMRSRYTAYTRNNSSYLLGSWHASTRPSSLDTTSIPRWLGLTILATRGGQAGDIKGVVEFEAQYQQGLGRAVLHERSRFVRENGLWYYVDGDHESNSRENIKKTGRNDLCPCGSGRKFKKCCLR